MYLKSNIKLLRNKKNISQEKLAKVIGNYSRGTVAKWETGETVPDIHQIDSMAKFFGISIDDFVHKDFNNDEAENITKTLEIAFDLFDQFIKGNEIIMNLIDVKVISRALIKKIKEEASRHKGYDAAKLFIEAGSLGDRESNICAISILTELMNESYHKESVDDWFKYKELYDEVKSRIIGISEKEIDYSLLSYDDKMLIMEMYYGMKTIDEDKHNQIIE